MNKNVPQLTEDDDFIIDPAKARRFYMIVFDQWFRIQAKEAAAQGEPVSPVVKPPINPELSLPPGVRP